MSASSRTISSGQSIELLFRVALFETLYLQAPFGVEVIFYGLNIGCAEGAVKYQDLANKAIEAVVAGAIVS